MMIPPHAEKRWSQSRCPLLFYPSSSCSSLPVLWSAAISPTRTSEANWQIRVPSGTNNINSLDNSCFSNYTNGCFDCVFSFHTSINFFPGKASIFCVANVAQLWLLLFYWFIVSKNNSPSMSGIFMMRYYLYLEICRYLGFFPLPFRISDSHLFHLILVILFAHFQYWIKHFTKVL